MKNLTIPILTALLLLAALPAAIPTANAQTTAGRDTRREARQLESEGWGAMQGNPPLAQQIADSRRAEADTTAQGGVRFFTATAQGSAGNYTAAKQIADSRARAQLAINIQTAIVRGLREAGAAGLSAKDLDAVRNYVASSQPLILRQLQDAVTVMEIYREKGNTCEVRIQLKIEAATALARTKSALQSGLAASSPQLADALGKLLPH